MHPEENKQNLINLFKRLPGIGPRQASRCVEFLRRSHKDFGDTFVDLVTTVRGQTAHCPDCQRLFSKPEDVSVELCRICFNPHRSDETILVVQQDIDIDQFEKTEAYDGKYFVLGGIVPVGKYDHVKSYIKIEELHQHLLKLKSNDKLPREIILALQATPEADQTVVYLKEYLREKFSDTLKIATLGRGLSTGTEIEYADPQTLTDAFNARK